MFARSSIAPGRFSTSAEQERLDAASDVTRDGATTGVCGGSDGNVPHSPDPDGRSKKWRSLHTVASLSTGGATWDC